MSQFTGTVFSSTCKNHSHHHTVSHKEDSTTKDLPPPPCLLDKWKLAQVKVEGGIGKLKEEVRSTETDASRQDL